MYRVTGRVERALRAPIFATGTGTCHSCLWLFSCTDLHATGGQEELPPVHTPAFIAIWDGDVLATVSPKWTLTVIVQRATASPGPGPGNLDGGGKWISLQGSEATQQSKRPGVFAGRGVHAAEAAVFRAVAMDWNVLPVPVKVETLRTLTRPELAKMLPQKCRTALNKRHVSLAPFATHAQASAALEGQHREEAEMARLQTRETYLPPVAVLLSAFVRPSAVRAMSLREARAVAELANSYASNEGMAYACAACDLFALHGTWAGRGLPNAKLPLQKCLPGQEAPWLEDVARQRAALQRSRSTPTQDRPLTFRLDDGGEMVLCRSAYEEAVAEILLGENVSLAAWCGSIESFVKDGHLESLPLHRPSTVFVAPNDAFAVAFHKLGVNAFSWQDITTGRAQIHTKDPATMETVVFLEAHTYGCRTLAMGCAFFPPTASLLFVGDPAHSFGAGDETDGGAPFRDAWASDTVGKLFGGQKLYGPFSRNILPDASSTGALFSLKDPFLVTVRENGDANSETVPCKFYCGNPDAPAACHGEEVSVTFVAGANTFSEAFSGDWKCAGQVTGGDPVLVQDCGELRVVRTAGRMRGGEGAKKTFFPVRKDPLRLSDADGFLFLTPHPAGRDHRLCCGTEHADLLSLARHTVAQGKRIPMRVACAVLPPCSLPGNVKVTLQEVSERAQPARHEAQEGAGGEVQKTATTRGVSVDDIRAVCKLATKAPLVETRRTIDEVFGSRAKSRVCGSLFPFLKEHAAGEGGGQGAVILQKLRDNALALEKAVAQNTRLAGALVALVKPAHDRRGKGPSDKGNEGGDDDDDEVAAPDPLLARQHQLVVFEGPPPPGVLKAMLTSDFENALRDRLNALLDASRVSVSHNNDDDDDDGEAGEPCAVAWEGAALRYPFAGRFASLLPAARQQLVTDTRTREKVAVVAVCKVCKGDPLLENWLVQAETALCQMRVRPVRLAERVAAAHVRNVREQLTRVKPLRARRDNANGDAHCQEQGERNELERALLRVQEFLQAILRK